MVRLGIVGTDSSHAVEFTKRLNHKEIEEEQWVDGAEILFAVPLPSEMAEESVVRGRAEELARMGVGILHSPEELLGKVDGALIESNDGNVHLEQSLPFIDKGIPVWIDKPLGANSQQAKQIVTLCKQRNTPLFSASSLRYSVEIRDLLESKRVGNSVSALTYSPYHEEVLMPGLIYYVIHAVEPLYALLGAGCKQVRCTWSESGPVAVGMWANGKIGIVRGLGEGCQPGYGFVAWGENGIVNSKADGSFIYRELLKEVVKFFETRESPVPVEETLEIIAFMEAANRSAKSGGNPVDVG